MTGSNVTHIRRRGDVLEEGKPTGQQIEWEERRARRGNRKKRKIAMTMVDTAVMTHLDMTGSEQRLLWAICSHIPKSGGSTAYVQVGQLAEELGVQKSFVSRTLAELRRRRIVETLRTGAHKVNPWILWNGMMDDWVDESEDYPEPIYHRNGVDPATGEVL
jgi:DNA-binding transcriptional ArsR family regulator